MNVTNLADASSESAIVANVIANAPEWITVLIATIVAIIAITSYFATRSRIRHELFERRFTIYRGFRNLLWEIQGSGRCELTQIFELNAPTEEARFLFGEDIYKYLSDIREHAMNLCDAERRLERDATDQEKQEVLEQEIKEENEWLRNQRETIHERFKPYMNLSIK